MTLRTIVYESTGIYTAEEPHYLYGRDAQNALAEWQAEGLILWFNEEGNYYVQLELECDENGCYTTPEGECYGHDCMHHRPE
mgnify:CR=1 FL=1